MLTLSKLLEIADYNIKECYEAWPKQTKEKLQGFYFIENDIQYYAIISLKTLKAVFALVADTKNAYCIVDPAFEEEYVQICETNGYEPFMPDNGKKAFRLELVDDFMRKATAIVNHKPYDERIAVSLELTDEEFIAIAQAAHDCDITINDYCNILLEEIIKEYESKDR